MRSLRAAEIGLRAERLRLRLWLRRIARRGALAAAACLFAAMLVLMLHLALVAGLCRFLPVWLAALAVAGADALAGAGCLWLAVRSRPGQAEREAAALGREARDELRRVTAVLGLTTEAVRGAFGGAWPGALISAVLAWVMRRRGRGAADTAPPPG